MPNLTFTKPLSKSIPMTGGVITMLVLQVQILGDYDGASTYFAKAKSMAANNGIVSE